MSGSVSDTMPSLADRMRALPDQYPLSSRQIAEINLRADELETACNSSDENWSLKKMLGAWARARRLWCEITDDDLI